MTIVPVDQIPKLEVIIDVPVDDLLQIYKFVVQMEQLCTLEKGIGLSAVQCGIPWRMFVSVNPKSYADAFPIYDYFVNCSYTPVGEDKGLGIEGCLSLKTKDGKLRYFEVSRHKKIRLTGHQLVVDPEMSLKPVDIEVEGLFAIAYQHEVDHAREQMVDFIGKELELR